MKRRFLHVTTFYPPYHFGGDAIYVQRLAEALGAAGHEVDVVHSLDAYHLMGGSPRPERNPRGVGIHRLSSPTPRLSGLVAHQLGHPWPYAKEIRRIMSRPYDVIHFHNISLLGPAILGYGRATKLYTTHEHWLICPMHVLWQYQRRVCREPQCLRCVLQARRPPQWWRYTSWLRRCCRHIDLFLAPSEPTAARHRSAGIPGPFRVLPLFAPEPLPDPPRPSVQNPYFLYVGRLEKLKGIHTLLRHFEQRQAELVIAGEGPEETALRWEARNNPRIHFLGQQTTEQLASWYRYARAVIVPSQTYETFATVIAEAFSYATPVLVSELGAQAGAVQLSGGGKVYSHPEELDHWLERWLHDPEEANRVGELAFEGYRRYWTQEQHLRQYLDLLS